VWGVPPDVLQELNILIQAVGAGYFLCFWMHHEIKPFQGPRAVGPQVRIHLGGGLTGH
jgi:hypothetical protein